MIQQYYQARITVNMMNHQQIRDWSHAHPIQSVWRLYWADDAMGTILNNGKKYPLCPDRVILIPPNTPIDRQLKKPNHLFYIHFELGLPYDLIEGEVFAVPAGSEIQALIRKLIDGPRTKPDAVCVIALIYALLAALPDIIIQKPHFDERIEQAITLIHQAPQRQWTNTKLAAKCAMSVNGFIRLFSKSVGRPPQQYVNELRLQKVCSLLTYSSISIEEIARQTGFCDRHYLTRQFQKKYQTGPSAFRKRGIESG